MATHRRTRRRRRPKASARAYIIPTILLYSTVGGMHGGLTVPISVLAASEQTTYSATQETNDEAIETSTGPEKTPTNQGRERNDGADERHQEQLPTVSSRTLQIRSGATAKSNGAAASVVSTENMTLAQILAKAAKKNEDAEKKAAAEAAKEKAAKDATEAAKIANEELQKQMSTTESSFKAF